MQSAINWAIQSNDKKRFTYIYFSHRSSSNPVATRSVFGWRIAVSEIRFGYHLSMLFVFCRMPLGSIWYMHRKFQSLPLHCNVSRNKMCVQCISRSQWLKKNCPYPKTIRWTVDVGKFYVRINLQYFQLIYKVMVPAKMCNVFVFIPICLQLQRSTTDQ